MAVTIGGVPPTTEQQAEMRAALGLPEPFDLTATKLTLVGADKVIGLDSEDSDTPKLFTLNGIATFTGASPGTLEGTMAAAETGADVFDGVGASASSDIELHGVTSAESGWGTTLSIGIPAGMEAGDNIVVLLESNSGQSVSGLSPGTWTARTPAGGMGTNHTLWISEPFVSVPASVTATFGGNGINRSRTYAAANVSTGAAVDSGSGSTTGSTDPRAHAYSTPEANTLTIMSLDFDGGGVTGGTGQDGVHTWEGLSGAYFITAAAVRATAGSYDATVGPTGAISVSNYWYAVLGGA